MTSFNRYSAVKNYWLAYLLFLLTFIATNKLAAQDLFFSQYYAQPVLLNPALAGTMEGTFRANMAYRQQWGPVLDKPFKTFAASMDTKLKFGKNFNNRDYFGGGLVLTHDNLGVSDYVADGLMLAIAYHKSLSRDKEQLVSFGINLGLQQRGVSYNTFTFQDEYDLVNGYTLTSSENLPDNKIAFFDFGLGINYSAAFGADSRYFMGLSASHINQPEISYYQYVDITNIQLENSTTLPMSLRAHIGATLPIGQSMYITPRLMASKQGQYIAGNVGSTVQFILSDFSESSLYLGASVRPVKNYDSTGLDAAILMVGFDRNNYAIGFSYDAQLNDLANERRGQNTFELTFTLTANYEDDALFCPKF